MKRSSLLPALPAALLLFVAAGRQSDARLHAASPVAPNPALAGHFVYSAEGSDDIEQVIQAGTARMGFIKRPIARSRLKKTNDVYRSITLQHTPVEISIAFDGRAPIVSPADGHAVKWARDDHETFDLSTSWEGPRLRQTFVAGDGSRENLFSISPDGALLTMQVTIRSPQLPGPIVYKLNYRRQV